MRTFSHLWKRLAPDIAARHAEEELDEEIQDHIDRLVRDLVIKGMSPKEAEAEGWRLAERLGAARAPISREDRKGILRERLGEKWISTVVLSREVMRILRTRWKTVTILSLIYAFGLTVAGAGFGLGYAVRNWLPGARDPESLHVVIQPNPTAPSSYTYEIDFETARALNDHPEEHHMFAESWARAFPVRGPSGAPLPIGPESARTSFVSPHYFELMGLKPSMGGLFGSGISLSMPFPAVLTMELWRSAFQGDPNVVGRDLLVGGLALRVVGVLPSAFQGVSPHGFEIAIPLALEPRETQAFLARNGLRPRDFRPMLLFRDPGGEKTVPALAEGRQLIASLEGRDRELALRGVVLGFAGGASPLYFLLVVSVLVLLLSAATGKGLLVLAGVRNARNDAVAKAIGATAAHLRVKVFLMGLIPILVGFALSVLPTSLMMEALRSATLEWRVPADRLVSQPTLISLLALSGAVLLLGTTLRLRKGSGRWMTHLGMGGGVISSRGRGSERALSTALWIQLLVSGCLLATTGLFWRSWTTFASQDIGYDAERLWVAPVQSSLLPPSQEGLGEARLDSLAQRVGEMPQVESVAWTDSRPTDMVIRARVFFQDGDRVILEEDRGPFGERVDSAFFSTVGLEILEGRNFMGAGEIMVSEAAASLIWPEKDPFSQCLFLSDLDGPCSRVVAIVEDARNYLFGPLAPMIYSQIPKGSGYRVGLVIRTEPGVGASFAGQLDALVAPLFPEARSVFRVRERSLESIAEQRSGYQIAGIFAAIALFLATAGYFGLFSLKVARSKGELAVKVALGANPKVLYREVVTAAVSHLLPVLVLTAATLYLGGFFLRPMLLGFPLVDPWVISATVVILLVVSLLSVTLPALEAMRVDPAEALKTEA